MSNVLAVHSLGSLETDIVVDLGCCGYVRGNGMEDSIITLVKRFQPTVLFGFDPHPGLVEGVGKVHGSTVITARRAAWTFDGQVGLSVNGNCTHVNLPGTPASGTPSAQAFDLATWVRALPEGKIVLKLDVEGAEYVLLPHLIKNDLMDRFSRVLIEWHAGSLANGYESDPATILEGIKCPTEEWQ